MRHPSDGISIVHGVVAILRQADSVVMVQQQGPDDSQPFWVLPGGMVEAGELITDALVREVQEEVGVQVTTITQLACLIQMDRPDHQSQTLLFAFEVGAWHGTLRSNDPDDEILAVELVPLAEAIRRLAGKVAGLGCKPRCLPICVGMYQSARFGAIAKMRLVNTCWGVFQREAVISTEELGLHHKTVSRLLSFGCRE